MEVYNVQPIKMVKLKFIKVNQSKPGIIQTHSHITQEGKGLHLARLQKNNLRLQDFEKKQKLEKKKISL